MKPLFNTQLTHLSRIQQGKVRDIFAVDEQYLLIVATDRLSAFDVILPTPIPNKGVILTALSNFWFQFTQALLPNHLTEKKITELPLTAEERTQIAPRSVIVRKLQPLPIEAVVRGYLVGSGWKDYQRQGTVCGIPLPSDLQQASQLPTPIYTPATKAIQGQHDENITFTQTVALLGEELATQVREVSIAIYQQAQRYALERGIIIADTKFEFGLDANGQLTLIDEVLTPDSSRFWPIEQYKIGISPPSFDKQFVRDYLETLAWDKSPPAPELPAEIVEKTAQKYAEAHKKLLNQPLPR